MNIFFPYKVDIFPSSVAPILLHVRNSGCLALSALWNLLFFPTIQLTVISLPLPHILPIIQPEKMCYWPVECYPSTYAAIVQGSVFLLL